MHNRYETENLGIKNVLTIAVAVAVCHSVSITKPVESIPDVVERLEDVILPARVC